MLIMLMMMVSVVNCLGFIRFFIVLKLLLLAHVRVTTLIMDKFIVDATAAAIISILMARILVMMIVIMFLS